MKKYNLLAGVVVVGVVVAGYWQFSSMIRAAVPAPLPVVSVATGTPSMAPTGTAEAVPTGYSVTVAFPVVNLRTADHSATGKTVLAGESLSVYWLPDGWGIVLAGDYKGLFIWRGCTSDPASRKCLSR